MSSGPRTVWMPGGVRTEIRIAGEDTDGAFCLLVDEPPAGWSLPAHLHRDAAETILVLEGAFDVDVAGERTRLSAGMSIHIPRGVVHASTNAAPHAGRRVVLFSPAGMEHFFLEAGAAAPDQPVDVAAALAAAGRHGWEFVR